MAMTDTIEQVIKKQFDHDAAKQILKEKYEAKMLFAAFGGMWKAGPTLLSTINTAPNRMKVIILDEYGNPCEIARVALYEEAEARWQEQMNGWYEEFTELQSKR